MNIGDLYQVCTLFSSFQWDHAFFHAKYEGKDAVDALAFLKRASDAGKQEKPVLSEMHRFVYPKRRYRTERMSALIAKLDAIIKRVVSDARLEARPQVNNRLVLNWLMEGGLIELARRHFEDIQEEAGSYTNKSLLGLSDYTLTGIEFYWMDLRVQDEMEEGLVMDILDQVQYFLLIQALSIKLSLVSLQRTDARSFPFPIGDLLLRSLEDLKYDRVPLVRLLQLAILIQSGTGTPAEQEEYEKLLDENIGSLGTKMGNILYVLKSNYQIYQYNTDHSRKNLTALFNTYETMWSRDMLLWGDSLSYFSYLNIVNIALTSDKVEWAERFIEAFKEHVPEEFRDSSYKFNRASLEFKKGNYNLALQYNLDVTFKNTNAFYACKRLTIKIFYCLGEWKALAHALETLQRYMNRKEDPSYHSGQRKNFVKNMRILLKMRKTESREKRLELFENIKSQSSTDHDWICEQAEGMMD